MPSLLLILSGFYCYFSDDTNESRFTSPISWIRPSIVLPVCEAVEVNERERRVERDLPEADQGTRGVDGDARQDVAHLRRGVVHEHAAQRETLA